MRQTTKHGSVELRNRVRVLERENEALQRRLRRLEATARPLNARLVAATR